MAKVHFAEEMTNKARKNIAGPLNRIETKIDTLEHKSKSNHDRIETNLTIEIQELSQKCYQCIKENQILLKEIKEMLKKQ